MFSSTTSALSSACSCAIAHFADLFRASAALLNIYMLWILSDSGITLDSYREAD
jgi:hypothetical protein